MNWGAIGGVSEYLSTALQEIQSIKGLKIWSLLNISGEGSGHENKITPIF